MAVTQVQAKPRSHHFDKVLNQEVIGIRLQLLHSFIRGHLGPNSRARKLFTEGIARVFYCTMIEGRIVMLHSFIKKTQETPSQELNTAKRHMKEIKHET